MLVAVAVLDGAPDTYLVLLGSEDGGQIIRHGRVISRSELKIVWIYSGFQW